ncbi:hypothetical protein PORY_000550 [Pneumocystis oryctolagi]|uniref:Uncharacterized protein n=1 Tax=Pneumocystis oryctolagi TaxID=42067 RepID=A0ACB7CH04_9ASCO|nr:hypothetical protein PORY_000550 [Pneumocystis oryctolagi]
MRVALFALSAQIGCALVAALYNGHRPDLDETEERDFLSAAIYNGQQLGSGYPPDSRRLYRRGLGGLSKDGRLDGVWTVTATIKFHLGRYPSDIPNNF